jgi:septum site-determining protein MinD
MIVAVGGGKGGVGKTTVALNLARELQGVLVEGDLTAGDLPQGRGPTLQDVLARRVAPLEAVERVGTVRILSAAGLLAAARACDLSEFDRALERIERREGVVVVDCPPGRARDVGIQTAAADVAVLVTTPEAEAIHDCYDSRELALDVETPVGCVVLNERDGTADEETVESIERRFGAPTTVVPADPAVGATVETGLPVHDRDGGEAATDPFAQIAKLVRQSESRVNPAATGA